MHRSGRTARLGAEGDAISFACERYAMSLPDIEAYIEQKIPSEPVTAELLTALPRAPRAAPQPGEEVDEDADESIGTIFKEAREQRIADEQRRGGGRSAGPGRGPAGGRSHSGDGKPRPPRPPRKENVAPVVAVAAVAAVAASQADGTSPEIAADTRPPRKRRRRRHGKPLENAEGIAVPSTTAAPVAAPAAPADNSSFLTRLGRKLKSLVSG